MQTTTWNQPLYERLVKDYDPNLDKNGVNGARFAERLSILGNIGLTSDDGVYRIGFSKEELAAKNQVIEWMKEAGLTVKVDGVGNVFGRYEGQNPSLPAILSGSHVDSVPNGGHFDGPLGVLAALEVVEAWKETGYVPLHPFEVTIFTDEEGSRFNGGLTGSQAMVGEADVDRHLKLIDIHNQSFEKVITDVGLTVEGFSQAKRSLDEIALFFEIHIEQGKRLESADLPVGIVTGIAGPCWIEMTFKGKAGHAGNTPMNVRQDALVAASHFIATVPTLPAKVSSSAVATVGKLEVFPNGVNVIPGEVKLYVDIRDIHENTRDEVVGLTIATAQSMAESYNVKVSYKETLRVEPVPISSDLQQKLAATLEMNNIPPFYLPSGAGHDAMIVGHHRPVAMLFVRSQDGISHNPKEWSSLSDCIQAVHVLKDFVEQF